MKLRETFAEFGLNELQHWIVSERLPLHFERSSRWERASMETTRGLFSIPLNAIKANADAEVLHICRSMSSPESVCRQIAERLPLANVIHFGFERSGNNLIAKCYVEYPSRTTAESLRFEGFKWWINNSRSPVVTQYSEQPVNSWRAVFDFCFKTQTSPFKNLLSAIAVTGDVSNVRLLEVSEPTNTRRSFDLNLYDLHIPVSTIAAELRATIQQFVINMSEFEDWLNFAQNAAMGHVAFGTGRNAHPFLTVYYAANVNDV